MSRAKRMLDLVLRNSKTQSPIGFDETIVNNYSNLKESSIDHNGLSEYTSFQEPHSTKVNDAGEIQSISRKEYTTLENVNFRNEVKLNKDLNGEHNEEYLTDFSTGSDEVYVPENDRNFPQSSPDVTIENHESNDLNEQTSDNDNDLGNIRRKRKIFPPKENKSKKRPKNEATWKKKKAALARERGEEYISHNNIVVPKKTIIEGTLCHEKCRLNCSQKFNLEEREKILKDFYVLDVNSKNGLLFQSTKSKQVERQRKNAKKHKSATYKYYVTFKGLTVEVCKLGLCGLYRIGRKKIDIIQDRIKNGFSAPPPDRRGKHNNRPHKVSVDVKNKIIEHISRFPAEQSHYSRNKNMYKLYLSPLLNVTKMHQLYLEMCQEEELSNAYKIKKSTYNKIFVTEFNLSFEYPRSDTCATCDAGECTELHKENYHNAIAGMATDRQKPNKNNNLIYLTLDLQQTMPLPKIPTSKAFYLRQIWFYNLGIHAIDGCKEKSFFFTWTEDQADRGSCEIASGLLRFVEINSCFNKNHLVVWSDSCAGQNKNFNLICLYQYMILKNYFKVIDHKFPEVGHSYLDSDRDFGRMEKVLRKHEAIYLPEQYREIICKSARENSVIDMSDHFRKIQDLQCKLKLINRKKTVNQEKVSFRDGIKWIRVEEYGSYLFKENYDEMCPFKKVDIKKRNAVPEDFELQRATEKYGKISEEKKDNIRDQLKFVKPEYRYFYESILATN